MFRANKTYDKTNERWQVKRVKKKRKKVIENDLSGESNGP